MRRYSGLFKQINWWWNECERGRGWTLSFRMALRVCKNYNEGRAASAHCKKNPYIFAALATVVAACWLPVCVFVYASVGERYDSNSQ